jgi:transposase
MLSVSPFYQAPWVSSNFSTAAYRMKEVALMLKRHLDNLLTCMRHPITNAVTEGFNSKIHGI